VYAATRCSSASALRRRCTPASGPQPYAHICASSTPVMQAPCTRCAVRQPPVALLVTRAAAPAPPRASAGRPPAHVCTPASPRRDAARASPGPRAHASTRLQNREGARSRKHAPPEPVRAERKVHLLQRDAVRLREEAARRRAAAFRGAAQEARGCGSGLARAQAHAQRGEGGENYWSKASAACAAGGAIADGSGARTSTPSAP
jgi:hypothetical protein